ncbi:heme-binding protein [Labrenzia sp. R4_1]|uniref:SOUL family heme-binding protein n=1 Tax=Labrenzia sp. R4_1 TaxID=2821106 RepID=UPI001ADB9CC2|nr:heme-binding protein [Labrenzia sp. R4_1]MBO9426228.1 heme-binding protein [Labrenzia sp. R4_1]
MVRANHDRATLQQPAYELLQEHRQFEIRHYPPAAAVRIVESNGRSEATRSGFNALYSYITGNNKGRHHYDMTAPVLQRAYGSNNVPPRSGATSDLVDGDWEMFFFLPDGVGAASAAEPINTRIQATTLGERKVAVRSFSGRWSDENFADEAMHLLASLTELGFTTTGPISFAFYDAPSVLPAKRYNEVQIEVE